MEVHRNGLGLVVAAMAVGAAGCQAPTDECEDDQDCDGIDEDRDCDDSDPTVGARYGPDGCMIPIAAGSFDMGCTGGQVACQDNELPVMPVTLTHAYAIGQTEVTQRQYKALVDDSPAVFGECGSTCPVEAVSWYLAARFANAASAEAGLTECYTCTDDQWDPYCELSVPVHECSGYRLPTEAEWEGAARCGQDLIYAGSDEPDTVAWWLDNSADQPHPVASLAPNDCGLFDMSGNVQEWVHDGYDAGHYTRDGRTDPVVSAGGIPKVIRGGGFSDLPELLRVSVRRAEDPWSSRADLGFRLARTLD